MAIILQNLRIVVYFSAMVPVIKLFLKPTKGLRISIISAFVVFLLGSNSVFAQLIENKPSRCWLFQAGGGLGLPGGNLGQRFGNHGEATVTLFYKTKTNWMFGLEGSFLFGEEIRENPLSIYLTREGQIIGNDGRFATIAYQQRGFRAPVIKIGKLFPAQLFKWMDPVASGFFVHGGVGFLQHQIDIIDVDRTLPYLQYPSAKGLDRMTNGVAIMQSAGFQFLSRNRWYGLFVALDLTQGFTRSQRYSTDLRTLDNTPKLDLILGLRGGFILPIFPRSGEEFYFD